MSLDKAIQHGKEKRKPYRHGKAVDSHCRNHGLCVWCRKNRLHGDKKREPVIGDALEGLPLRIYPIKNEP